MDTGLGACTGVDAEELALGVGRSERYQFLDRGAALLYLISGKGFVPSRIELI